jgi:hypothetical protein
MKTVYKFRTISYTKLSPYLENACHCHTHVASLHSTLQDQHANPITFCFSLYITTHILIRGRHNKNTRYVGLEVYAMGRKPTSLLVSNSVGSTRKACGFNTGLQMQEARVRTERHTGKLGFCIKGLSCRLTKITVCASSRF